MNKVQLGFFSFTEITDPTEHRAYNEWHLLDHMPEQFPLPGVAYGQRWVRTPDGAAVGQAVSPLDRCHYMTLYLMTDPVEQTLDDFQLLGEQLRAAGRFHRARVSHLAGAFALVGEAVSPRVRIRSAAVPYRPHSGVHVYVERIIDPIELDAHLAVVAGERVPALLAVEGVVGTWEFAATPRLIRRHPATDGVRIRVTWVDDPGLLKHDQLGTILTSADNNVSHVLISGPLACVTPGRYDWFETSSR